uniref:Uncharacterized protein n=1 Tax=Arundo donax TaxID=35708 RepID=A0A0A9DFT9_ARUDO
MTGQAWGGAPAPVVGHVHPEHGTRTGRVVDRNAFFGRRQPKSWGWRMLPTFHQTKDPASSMKHEQSFHWRAIPWLRCRRNMQRKQPGGHNPKWWQFAATKGQKLDATTHQLC